MALDEVPSFLTRCVGMGKLSFFSPSVITFCIREILSVIFFVGSVIGGFIVGCCKFKREFVVV